jgi:hypothetical protein
MKEALIFSVVMLVVFTAAAQTNCSFRLLRSPEEINSKTRQGLPIKNIRRSYRADSIFVRTEDKKGLWLAGSSVWGYEDSHCTVYRNAFHDFLQTEAVGDSIITYSQTYTGFRGKRIKRYYFSRRFDTPVYKLDKASIHEQFKRSPDLIERLEKKFNL